MDSFSNFCRCYSSHNYYKLDTPWTNPVISATVFVLNSALSLFSSKKSDNLFEGMITSFEIKNEKGISKRGALVLCIIVVLILLAVYFLSFWRLETMPQFIK